MVQINKAKEIYCLQSGADSSDNCVLFEVLKVE